MTSKFKQTFCYINEEKELIVECPNCGTKEMAWDGTIKVHPELLADALVAASSEHRECKAVRIEEI